MVVWMVNPCLGWTVFLALDDWEGHFSGVVQITLSRRKPLWAISCSASGGDSGGLPMGVQDLAAPLKGIFKEVMESTFVNGLLPKIQVEICLLQPCGLGHLMEMAQWVEDKNLTLWAAVNQRTQRTPKYCRLQIRGIGRLGKIFKLRQRLLARKQRTNNGRFWWRDWWNRSSKPVESRGYVLSVMKFSPGHHYKKELRVLLVHKYEKEGNQFNCEATVEPQLIELKMLWNYL